MECKRSDRARCLLLVAYSRARSVSPGAISAAGGVFPRPVWFAGRDVCYGWRIPAPGLVHRARLAVEVEDSVGDVGDGVIVGGNHDARSSDDHRAHQLEDRRDVAGVLMARRLVGE